METYEMVRRGDKDLFWAKAANVYSRPKFSEGFKDLVWQMVQTDPDKRIFGWEA